MTTQHRTIVLQSYRTSDVPRWISLCMHSVQRWAALHRWDYLLMGDEFLALPPDWARQHCGDNIYAITDLARLIWMHQKLEESYQRVIWADADMLVMDAGGLGSAVSGCEGHAFARELFLKVHPDSGTSMQHGINNAFMVFDCEDPVLSIYLSTSLRQVQAHPPQRVPRTALGPHLIQRLSQQHHLKTLDRIGLFTPAMMQELAQGQHKLLDQYQAELGGPALAANLCHFMRNMTPPATRPLFDSVYEHAVLQLMNQE